MNLAPGKIEKLEIRVRQSPGSQAFARLADHHRLSGNMEKAISLCEEGIRHNPGYATGHLLLGRCYYQKERMEEAAREFKTVLTVDPKNVFALKTLGDLSALGGRRGEAARYYREAADFDPLNLQIRELFRQFEMFLKEGSAPSAPSPVPVPTPAPEAASPPAPEAAQTPAPEVAQVPAPEEAAQAPVPEPRPASDITEAALSGTAILRANIDTTWQEHVPEETASPPETGAESPRPLPAAAPAPMDEVVTEMVDLPSEMQDSPEEGIADVAGKTEVPPALSAPSGTAAPAGVSWPEADDELKQFVASVRPQETGQKPLPAAPGSPAEKRPEVSGPEPGPEVELGNEVDLAIPPQKEAAREQIPAAAPPPVPAELPAEEDIDQPRVVSNVATDRLADIYLRQGYKEQALAVYRKMLDKKPDNEKIKAKIKKLEDDIGRSYGGKKEGKKRNG